jgi:hypothetical protein
MLNATDWVRTRRLIARRSSLRGRNALKPGTIRKINKQASPRRSPTYMPAPPLHDMFQVRAKCSSGPAAKRVRCSVLLSAAAFANCTQIENIELFTDRVTDLGVRPHENFTASDLCVRYKGDIRLSL